jgi:hypothetical protein
VKPLTADVIKKPAIPEMTTKQQDLIDEIDNVFDEWSQKSGSSEENSPSSDDDDPIVGIAFQREATELMNTDSESEHPTAKKILTKPNSIKSGWKKIEIWKPSTENNKTSQKKKKPKATLSTPQRSPPECARHLLEQLSEENVHSVANALLLYPQQVSADAVCRYCGQISQNSKISDESSAPMKLIRELFRSLMFVVPSEQGLVLYKSIFLALQHQIFSLLKTGDGPQHILIRKSLLGIDSKTNDKSQTETEELSSSAEINALLDEGLDGLSDSDGDSDVSSVHESRDSEGEGETEPIVKSADETQDSLNTQTSLYSPEIPFEDQVNSSSSSRDNDLLTYFSTNLVLSSAFELVNHHFFQSLMFLRVDFPQFDSS